MVMAVLLAMGTDTAKLTDVRTARFGRSRYLVRESELFVENKVQIARRMAGYQ